MHMRQQPTFAGRYVPLLTRYCHSPLSKAKEGHNLNHHAHGLGFVVRMVGLTALLLKCTWEMRTAECLTAHSLVVRPAPPRLVLLLVQWLAFLMREMAECAFKAIGATTLREKTTPPA